MFILDFDVDEEELSGDRENHPELAEPDFLRTCYFFMPVRFIVGGQDLLEWQGGGYPVPLLYFAINGWRVVRDAGRYGYARIDVPETGYYLTFQVSEGDVTVHSDQTGRTGWASYAELLSAWRDFQEKVSAFLVREVPALKTHPLLRDWLGQED